MPRKTTRVSQPRLGLCCLFVDEPGVRFRTTTVRNISRFPASEARQRLLALAELNALALVEAVRACKRLGIGAFRVLSGLMPLSSHPQYAYDVADLPAGTLDMLRKANSLAVAAGIRLSFHPDQFILLGSPSSATTDASLRDLTIHGDQADILGVDVINLHGGGGYGDKPAALDRVARNLERLPANVRKRLALENDDKIFHVQDLLPLCLREGIPLTYDVHHHRCHPDGLSIEEATQRAVQTWDREPHFHVSSPRDGWTSTQPRRHADMIDPADFPVEWLSMKITVDVEAKAKERAVLDLKGKLGL